MHFPEEAIAAAAFLFERVNGNKLSKFEIDEIERCGLSDIDPQFVAKELMATASDDRKSGSTYRQQAYWALGKLSDEKLMPFFRMRLELELRRDLLAVYQILIALDNLNQPVFSKDRLGNVGIHEYEANRKDAQSYLDSL